MDNKTELEKVKAEIESKQEEKEKYEKKLAQLKNQEMKYKIIFSENVKRDLISIVRYIADELLESNIAEKLSYRIFESD